MAEMVRCGGFDSVGELNLQSKGCLQLDVGIRLEELILSDEGATYSIYTNLLLIRSIRNQRLEIKIKYQD